MKNSDGADPTISRVSDSPIAVSGNDPTQSAQDRELQESLLPELICLQPSTRAAVILCCVERRSKREAAEIMGSTRWAVGREVRLGLNCLHEKLTAGGFAIPSTGLSAALRGAGESISVPTGLSGTVHSLVFEGGKVAVAGGFLGHTALIASAKLKALSAVAAAVVFAACGTALDRQIASDGEGDRPGGAGTDPEAETRTEFLKSQDTPGSTDEGGKVPEYLRLLCTFDFGLHGHRGAVNPFSASAFVEHVKQGKGGFAHFQGHDPFPNGLSRRGWERSALMFSGRNAPEESGTLALRVRFSGKRHWSDGKRAWLAALVPLIYDSHMSRPVVNEGTGLAVIKNEENDLILAVHQFVQNRLSPDYRSRGGGRRTAPPSEIPLKIRASELKKDEWTTVRLGWDRKKGKVWLGVGDVLEEAKLTFRNRESPWRSVLFATPPTVRWVRTAEGFDGDFDDLVVDARTPEQEANAGLVFPRDVPAAKLPKAVVENEVHIQDDPWGGKVETIVRTHLSRVIETQRRGGWAGSTAYPSMIRFYDRMAWLPISDETFKANQRDHSAAIALKLLAGYEALGEKAYVEAAERTAETLLKIQAVGGFFSRLALVDAETGDVNIHDPADAPFEDHVQSYPTLLMWRLQEITGKPKYAKAAEVSVEFILEGQNPNGSWSHHFNMKKRCGETLSRHKHGGEINDYATYDQMTVMLIAYRKTGDSKYLASWLKAADWLVEAFVDKKAKGWAQQYDGQNSPVGARDHEPAAVSLSEGCTTPARALMQTYRMTGDERYLNPLKKWKIWMERNKTRKGWFPYYDIETGNPIMMVEGRIRPADPRLAGDQHMSEVLRELGQIGRPMETQAPNVDGVRMSLKQDRYRVDRLNRMFDMEAGGWLSGEGLQRRVFLPGDTRMLASCRAVFHMRQIRGQIPWDHRWSTMTWSDWRDLYHVIPAAKLYERLSTEEIVRAQALVRWRRPRGDQAR
jgi:hypothetical protein